MDLNNIILNERNHKPRRTCSVIPVTGMPNWLCVWGSREDLPEDGTVECWMLTRPMQGTVTWCNTGRNPSTVHSDVSTWPQVILQKSKKNKYKKIIGNEDHCQNYHFIFTGPKTWQVFIKCILINIWNCSILAGKEFWTVCPFTLLVSPFTFLMFLKFSWYSLTSICF